jgi:enediyne biosynthesis protein E4
MIRISIPLFFLTLILLCYSCSNRETDNHGPEIEETDPLFTLIPSENTGVDFKNQLTEGLNTNVLIYEYFYNGGGVAVADFDGDGLEDLYFTGNMVANRLYLNRGNLSFEDITQAAGVSGREGPWATGVTIVDINADGLPDIYVCYSGNVSPQNRTNQLFVNQGPNTAGIPVFKEQSQAYGLDIDSYSTQAIFFDFDQDGDLDMFLLNHNIKSLPVLDEASTAELLKHRDPSGSQLFRNDNGKYVEITSAAGIENSALSYGLGVGVADLNGDGWPDIYVSNDYTAPDYLYFNNKNGTFTQASHTALGHMSQFSMGSDLADFNNDGWIDILSLDMLPEDNKRQKLLMAPDNYEKFDFMVKAGLHHQYMRNMLHLNNGNGTFSEIGQLAGISNTDWSWAGLFADLDNDGWKDLYITNGYQRDYTNLDFLKYMGDYVQTHQGNLKRQNILDLVDKIPASDIRNYIFQNNGDLSFKDQTQKWGLHHISNSNGAAYADLDNDGDLELIVNNINAPASIYQNLASEKLNAHYLKIRLKGEGQNSMGLGANVTIYHDGIVQKLEQMPTRGYQSSVSPILHFGLGNSSQIDSLSIIWQSGKRQHLSSINSSQVLELREAEAQLHKLQPAFPKTIFSKVNSAIAQQPYRRANDFKRQALLPNPISGTKSALAIADVNQDGIPDVYVGGSAGISAQLLFGRADGTYSSPQQAELMAVYQDAEDTHALFADLNGNGWMDLYVGSGGYGNFSPEDSLLQDRIYWNNGKGKFTLDPKALPRMHSSTSTVSVSDVNGDGMLDIFVGGRVVPGQYPSAPQSRILINQGNGIYEEMTKTWAPELTSIGMVTDATWTDINRDGKEDLIVVGEWMAPTVWLHQGDHLALQDSQYFGQDLTGWWNSITVADLNGDGQPDFLLGNYGLNSQITASEKEPVELFYKDFDGNGSIDPMLTFYIQGKRYPFVTRDELLEHFTNKRAKFPSYGSYAEAKLEDVFSPEELQGAGHFAAVMLESGVLLSGADKRYQFEAFPLLAQAAPIYAIHVVGLGEEKLLLTAGNIGTGRLRLGKIDANHGLVLRIDSKGKMKPIPQLLSGITIQGDVRNILQVTQNRLAFQVVGEGIRFYDLNFQQ